MNPIRMEVRQFFDACQEQTIETLLAESGLLIIAGVQLSDKAFIDLAQTFGEIVLPSKQNQNHQYQEILRVLPTSNVGRGWHTDLAFRKNPPRYTFMLCRKAPKFSGETLFIHTCEVVQHMTSSMKARFANLKGKYSFHTIFSQKLAQRGMELSEKQRQATPDTTHPLLKRHPLTQRETIHLHEEYLIGIEGYSKEAALQQINELYRFVFQSKYIYSHAWSVYDLVVWDNRVLLHKGNPIHPCQTRELDRILIQ